MTSALTPSYLVTRGFGVDGDAEVAGARAGVGVGVGVGVGDVVGVIGAGDAASSE